MIPRDYLQDSIDLFVRRLKNANPDLSEEDIIYLASVQIRSILPFGEQYRQMALANIEQAKQDAKSSYTRLE